MELGNFSISLSVKDIHVSKAFYEKLGFTKVATHVNSWRDQLGILQSSIDYELTRFQYEDGVRWIDDPDLKEEIAEKVLTDLSDWFGIPENTKAYIQNSRNLSFFAYYKDAHYVGFVVLKETSQYAAEICVMGVLKEYHRKQIGKRLLERFMIYAKSCNYEFLQVKTVDAGYYKEYDQTRLFYESMGFKKLEVFPTLWDEWNPCLLMIQTL